MLDTLELALAGAERARAEKLLAKMNAGQLPRMCGPRTLRAATWRRFYRRSIILLAAVNTNSKRERELEVDGSGGLWNCGIMELWNRGMTFKKGYSVVLG